MDGVSRLFVRGMVLGLALGRAAQKSDGCVESHFDSCSLACFPHSHTDGCVLRSGCWKRHHAKSKAVCVGKNPCHCHVDPHAWVVPGALFADLSYLEAITRVL